MSGVVETPVVAVEGLTKRYGEVIACDRVDLDLHHGRIHGILGENGAGKTTLMRMLVGLVLPDAGTIAIDGKRCTITDPIDAAAHGIGMVHQHLSLVDALTVWENVALGDDQRLDREHTCALVAEISRRYGLEVNPYAVVADLPVGIRQRVELIKCLRRDPRVLILDEPTSLLTPEESRQLFAALRTVVDSEDRTVALVSHRLDEVLEATDDITVMRRGRVVDRIDTADTDAAELANAMVGRSVIWRGEERTLPDEPDPTPILEIRGATVVDDIGHRPLDAFDLSVGAGEIVGVAGIDGNGQTELVDVMSSLTPLSDGSVVVDGVEVPTGRAGAMTDAGIGVIPADRHDSGVVLEMTVAQNLAMVDIAHRARFGIVHRADIDDRAGALIDEYDIDCAGPDAPMWSLSGGNQQRVVLARELSRGPRVLIAAQPTRGLDVGAIEYLNAQLRAAADRGVGVMLISAEIDEVLDLSSRIAVIFGGTIIGGMPRGDADREHLGMLLGGVAT